MLVRGVRGATTVSENTKDEIVSSTAELLEKMISENKIDSENIASIIFTTTSDVFN
ncbi:MAG: chorismate mutase, partial [SAR202 cluster bacterium]|nr:chorismate mutase [SAR202 cluster bacterium]